LGFSVIQPAIRPDHNCSSTQHKSLGIELITEEVRSPEEFAAAFASLRAKGAEAVLMRSSHLLFGFRKELCNLR
jgi:hypothetical protein